MSNARDILRSARRVVVKVGTRVLLSDDRALDRGVIDRLVGEIVALRERGLEVVVVSSGAIGAGLAPLGFERRPTAIPELQAAAAVGQGLLMETYHAALAPHRYAAAQVLLTHEDFKDRQRYLNVRNTLLALNRRRVLVVVNENDTVSVDEIKFGDNDILSALVSNLLDADLLVMLSDVDGLYEAPPGRSRASPPAAKAKAGESRERGSLPRRLDVVETITPAIEALAGEPGSDVGTGGMVSKLRAAKTAAAAGAAVVLADGRAASLAAILRGDPVGTLFLAAEKPLDHRKRWIAHSLREAGAVGVDAGGVKAVREGGKSLLPAGVKTCEGNFLAGDAVAIRGPDGKDVAKGVANYSADEIRRIMGVQTKEIEKVLGYKYFDEVVHRDNMVVY